MIIFDMDGTLWDTVDVSTEAAKKLSDNYIEVKEITKEQIKNGMGSSRKENGLRFMPYLDEDKRDFYMGKLNEFVVELLEEKGATLYEGVVETIKDLSKNYKIGIITNNNDKYVELFIRHANLNDYITDYMGASNHNISKAEAIKIVCDRNNEPNSYYVGDIKKDMDSTLEAGKIFIHARYGFEPDLKCEYHIDNIYELKDLIKKIPN